MFPSIASRFQNSVLRRSITWRIALRQQQMWRWNSSSISSSTSVIENPDLHDNDIIEKEEFQRLMYNVGLDNSNSVTHQSTEFPIAVAVSGGIDSLSLTLLTQEWLQQHHNTDTPPLLAITIDHQLRPESSAEALQVGKWMKAHGIEHVIRKCTWEATDDMNQIQSKARDQRYSLFTEICTDYHVKHLLLGHHFDDQMETLLLRFGRASGLSGLAGIPPKRPLGTSVICRPLLPVRKHRLRHTCVNRFNQTWVEDPSNQSDSYDRVRVRKALRVLESRYSTSYLNLMSAMHRNTIVPVVKHLETLEKDLLSQYATIHHSESAALDLALINDPKCFEELAFRILSTLATTVGNPKHPPRLRAVRQLWQSCCKNSEEQFIMTLANCIVKVTPGRIVEFLPEKQ